MLPRLRLAIEGEITRLLQHGIALPQTRDGAPPATTLPAADGTLRWLNVHINLAHLEALARHQSGR